VRALTSPDSPAFAEPEKAAVLAGYSHKSADRLPQEPGLKGRILSVLERAGIAEHPSPYHRERFTRLCQSSTRTLASLQRPSL